jgi:hypothetical protein
MSKISTRAAFSGTSITAALLSVCLAPVMAAPKTVSVKPHGPHVMTKPSAAPSSPTSRSAQPRGGPHGAGPKVHGNPNKPTKTTGPAPTGTTSGSPSVSGPSPTTPPLNPIAQKVSSNRGLLPKVTALLPTGMTLDQASFHFKNQGQFIAALHVSQNLQIPFADIKEAMTGIRPVLGEVPPVEPTTPSTTAPLSLGQAIKKLRPTADPTGEASTAERQATSDLGTASKPAPTSGQNQKKKNG